MAATRGHAALDGPLGESTGLGLHLSRQIVYNHGGTLELVSVPGWGACFEMRLPAPRHP
jgi:signal transduction histidine kinase